ncbi:MAG: hypothetical protein M3444_17880 [Acidobacteriota bacterium]|nr:hypothetical protein [Acidobacteriota bacterium]
MKLIDRRQKVLAQLDGGARTWGELRALTRVSDDNLGIAIGELLDLRKIWTGQSGDERVYGLERRKGLAPRFAHERRRAGDRLI